MSEKMIRDMQKQSNQQNQPNQSNFPHSNMRIKFMVNGKEVPLTLLPNGKTLESLGK